ncbi:RdgB/HAM1 family non-canonical purine NTP pyrophosphatase [Aerolutibacter ruishenii]|uniref:dITP/XTP pyrophosphatase n=1 Tax=Aerolutibacter ruishenii TaxID=686800 RepID=A0A562LJX1_9GAMM|nr:RdgB/HAM1 family non-canonical purine NTP pyrophosphatase [Lysobacter ruishenii]TWI07924.1 XTP/dITP diphosphohydrolase [Lysobacter ruishenii]
MKLVLASGNAGKLAELNAILGESGFTLVSQSSLGVEDVPETGLTFLENALIKARHAARVTGLPALADDSGLCVDALGGAPGLYSARYAGVQADAEANIDKLLAAMNGMPEAARTAHFIAVLVLLRQADDPQPLVVEGRWEGLVLPARRGAGGFGYDPVFLDPGSGQTAAELAPASKNRISHRGQALAQLKARLQALSLNDPLHAR